MQQRKSVFDTGAGRHAEAEWKIMPEAIRLIAQGRVQVVDGRTVITE